jgi:hypothetical protein
MVESGVLVAHQEKMLGFPVTRYAHVSEAPRNELIGSVRNALLGAERPEAQLVALTGLLVACGIAEWAVAKDEHAVAIRCAKKIAASNPAAESVGDAMREVEAGVMAAVIASIAST